MTVKQEKFCIEYIKSGNATEAYKKAFNAENMKPTTINKKAYELLKKD
jgi:phage terminase small subunit